MSAVNVTFSDERLCLKKNNKEIIYVTNKKIKTKQNKGKLFGCLFSLFVQFSISSSEVPKFAIFEGVSVLSFIQLISTCYRPFKMCYFIIPVNQICSRQT